MSKFCIPLAASFVLSACAAAPKPAPETSSPTQIPAAQIAGQAEFPPPEAMVGISGLSLHPTNGRYYAVSERGLQLFALVVGADGRPVVQPPIPITGVPDDVDLESVAFVDANTIVFGTESKAEARTEDQILYGAFTDTGVTVLDERTRAFFSYKAYGVRPDPNRGVEGLCAIDATLIAASEQTVERDGVRVAFVQVYDPLTRGWTPYELPLTSTDGKISAIVCTANARAFKVVAIERHYGTMRLIEFSVPRGAPAMTRLESKLLVDLAPVLGPKPKNFEGLASFKGGLFLISDNSYGQLDGPTTLLYVTPPNVQMHRWGGAIQ